MHVEDQLVDAVLKGKNAYESIHEVHWNLLYIAFGMRCQRGRVYCHIHINFIKKGEFYGEGEFVESLFIYHIEMSKRKSLV